MVRILMVIFIAVLLAAESKHCKKKGKSSCLKCIHQPDPRPDLDCPVVGYDCSDYASIGNFTMETSERTGCARLRCSHRHAQLFVLRNRYDALRCRGRRWQFGPRQCDYTFHAVCAKSCKCKSIVPLELTSRYIQADLYPLTESRPCSVAYASDPRSRLVGLNSTLEPTVFDAGATLTCNGDQQWVDGSGRVYQYAVAMIVPTTTLQTTTTTEVKSTTTVIPSTSTSLITPTTSIPPSTCGPMPALTQAEIDARGGGWLLHGYPASSTYNGQPSLVCPEGQVTLGTIPTVPPAIGYLTYVDGNNKFIINDVYCENSQWWYKSRLPDAVAKSYRMQSIGCGSEK